MLLRNSLQGDRIVLVDFIEDIADNMGSVYEMPWFIDTKRARSLRVDVLEHLVSLLLKDGAFLMIMSFQGQTLGKWNEWTAGMLLLATHQCVGDPVDRSKIHNILDNVKAPDCITQEREGLLVN